MNRLLLVQSLIYVLLYAGNVIAKNQTPSVRPKEDPGWRENGVQIQDSENIKSKKGFGAQLWIINDHKFFDDWNEPETPKVPVTRTAIRNEPIHIILLFINPGIDSESKANVTADVTITAPNGEIYGEFKDIDVWKAKYDSPNDIIQLSRQNMTLVIEDDEQLGLYKVAVRIRDNIKEITLNLSTEFTAMENK